MKKVKTEVLQSVMNTKVLLWQYTERLQPHEIPFKTFNEANDDDIKPSFQNFLKLTLNWITSEQQHSLIAWKKRKLFLTPIVQNDITSFVLWNAEIVVMLHAVNRDYQRKYSNPYISYRTLSQTPSSRKNTSPSAILMDRIRQKNTDHLLKRKPPRVMVFHSLQVPSQQRTSELSFTENLGVFTRKRKSETRPSNRFSRSWKKFSVELQATILDLRTFSSEKNSCADPVEHTYFSANYKDVCFHCGQTDDLNRESDYPVCGSCGDKRITVKNRSRKCKAQNWSIMMASVRISVRIWKMMRPMWAMNTVRITDVRYEQCENMANVRISQKLNWWENDFVVHYLEYLLFLKPYLMWELNGVDGGWTSESSRDVNHEEGK